MKKMIFIGMIFLFIPACFGMSVSDLAQEKIKDADGRAWTYDPYWQADEKMVKGNIDKDPEEEIVISFAASHKFEDCQTHLHIWQIYDLINGKYKLIKTTFENDYPGELMLKDLNNDGINEIIIFSHGGAHFSEIFVYQWRKNHYRKIWSNGSGCGVEIVFGNLLSSPMIRVGVPDWENSEWCYAAEPLWAIYQWDGKTFAYNKDLSTPGIKKEYIAYRP